MRYPHHEVFLSKAEKLNLKKNVLVAPLNWGIGHAARCVPVIDALLAEGHGVFLASDGDAKRFLESQYPDLLVWNLPSYQITYPKKGFLFIWHMITLLPKILKAIKKEHIVLDNWIAEMQLDVVISDNRYGMYSSKLKSIIISHQLRVIVPFFQAIVGARIKLMLHKFDQIWVPDSAEDMNLSGELGHHVGNDIRPIYIGLLSRMGASLKAQKPDKFPFQPGFVLAVLSGPEPLRTNFEEELWDQLSTVDREVVMVGGKLGSQSAVKKGNIYAVGFANSAELKWLLLHSNGIICRSGYSTLMDLVTLKKRAIIVPTPGQTEQEYLGEYLKKQGVFVTRNQSTLKIEEALKSLGKRSGNFQIEALNSREQLPQLIAEI